MLPSLSRSPRFLEQASPEPEPDPAPANVDGDATASAPTPISATPAMPAVQSSHADSFRRSRFRSGLDGLELSSSLKHWRTTLTVSAFPSGVSCLWRWPPPDLWTGFTAAETVLGAFYPAAVRPIRAPPPVLATMTTATAVFRRNMVPLLSVAGVSLRCPAPGGALVRVLPIKLRVGFPQRTIARSPDARRAAFLSACVVGHRLISSRPHQQPPGPGPFH